MDSGTNTTLKGYVKIAFFAFCAAVFFIFLYIMFVPQVGRYRVVNDREKDIALMVYIDTSTGKIYRLWDGKLHSAPHN